MKDFEIDIGDEKIAKIQCEDDCAISTGNVLRGEYDIDVGFSGRPVILDIGANIGAFAIWALKRFNPIKVYCYEPLKINFEQLKRNVENLPTNSTEFMLVNASVEAPTNKLYLNTQGTASSSFYNFTGKLEEFEEVEHNLTVEELPDCGVLKADTEGCEKEIITKYMKTHNRPTLILFEYHRDLDRIELDRFLYEFGYRLCGGYFYGLGFGVAKYISYNCITTPKEQLLR